uniref:Uncharacterized protein n=1 Tax=Alexandrium monilatum TaxID=311494 RepID=A0A7S4UVB6_9DINO
MAAHMDILLGNPSSDDRVWKGRCEQEYRHWAKTRNLHATAPAAASSQSLGQSGNYYRLPVPGEPVTVSGMRRRPELNGARGEIVNGTTDEFGRITVRIYDSTAPGAGSSRKMKIQPFRLVPSGSAPTLGAPSIQDDRSSVRSISRPGSLASGMGGRALGSAISSSAKGALEGRQRLQTPAPSGLGQTVQTIRSPSAASLRNV